MTRKIIDLEQERLDRAAAEIKKLWNQGRQHFLEMGQTLLEARERYSPERFEAFYEMTQDGPFHMSTALRDKLMEASKKGLDGITEDLVLEILEELSEKLKEG